MSGSAIDRACSSGASARGIGARGLVVFYVTSIVGAGILIVPGIAAREAGPASLVAWTVLGLASFPIAMMFAEMSARRPDCGGIAALIRGVLGASAGDTASLLLVGAYVLLVPVLAIASARHLCDLISLDVGFVKPLAAGFVVLSGAFCLASVATAAKLQGIVLIVLITCLLVAVALAVPSMSAARFRPFAPHGWAAVGAALPTVFFSFLGWENVSTIAEEVRDPRRSFHQAIRIAVPLVGILYLGVTAGFLALPPARSMLVMPTLLLEGVGTSWRKLGDVFGLAVIVPATNAWLLGASRMVLATAREGPLPERLQRRSSRTGAPIWALSALIVACVLVVALLAVLEVDESYALSLTAAMFLGLYIAAAFATLRDRPSPTMTLSAIATGSLAVVFLPFTGWALPVAALLALATHIRTRLARSKDVISSTTRGSGSNGAETRAKAFAFVNSADGDLRVAGSPEASRGGRNQ